MNKITYWLRKMGILRTSSYKVSGDAEKLNEINASDGGMMQSQSEINTDYKNKTSSQNNQKNKRQSKFLFWIFLGIGILLCILMLMMGFSWWFILGLSLWAWFLRIIWLKTISGTIIVWKTIIVGIVLIIISFLVIGASVSTPDNDLGEQNELMIELDDRKQSEEKSSVINVVKRDKISLFFDDLQEGTGVNFEKDETATNVIWTNGGAGLSLQNGKEIKISDSSSKDWKAIKKYFEDNQGTHGTIGMVFKGASNQDGYYFQDGKYKMLMCVLTKVDNSIKVGCGWGPGGEK